MAICPGGNCDQAGDPDQIKMDFCSYLSSHGMACSIYCTINDQKFARHKYCLPRPGWTVLYIWCSFLHLEKFTLSSSYMAFICFVWKYMSLFIRLLFDIGEGEWASVYAINNYFAAMVIHRSNITKK